MGNSCCRGEASSSMVFPHFHSAEKESLLDNKTSSSASYDDYDKQHREVKIKITKEKLEELLGTADVHGMSVDQVVARLLSASADHHYYDPDGDLDLDSHHHRSWRPALQTIPEVN
ncbi:hypothetical protein DCAR_0104510 [Daucus carota subsp. sativus]|uniref:Uncharacterized protein n=1 Tax=Daucus carota subsp. sativus TaxID=79200 RepID=A0A166IWA6_DAUCS|nr:hypothetical protein DCAR_0104510 [Daucus carota subsp. sativus]